MTIEVLQTVIKPGQTVTLQFSGKPSTFVFGITGFALRFQNGEHHHVLEMGITLKTPGVDNANNMPITAVMTLSDSTKHVIDPDLSWVKVAVIGLTDVSDRSRLTLANNFDVSATTEVPDVSFPDNFNTQPQAFLAGFDMAYGDGDHKISQIGLAISAIGNPNQGNVTFVEFGASMSGDGKTNSSGTGLVNSGLVVNADPTLRLYALSFTQDNNGSTKQLDFSGMNFSGNPAIGYVAFLNQVQANYGTSRDLDCFAASIAATTNTPWDQAGSALTAGGGAYMSDNVAYDPGAIAHPAIGQPVYTDAGANRQQNNRSNVGGWVFAYGRNPATWPDSVAQGKCWLPGQMLYTNYAPGSAWLACYQADGDIMIYHLEDSGLWRPVKHTNTGHSGPGMIEVSEKGIFRMFGADGNLLYQSVTAPASSVAMVLQTNGDLFMYISGYSGGYWGVPLVLV